MLELLAYAVLILVVMPALLLGVGKLVAVYNAKLLLSRGAALRAASSNGAAPHAASPAPQNYETLHKRLVAAAEANPLSPRIFSRPKTIEEKV